MKIALKDHMSRKLVTVSHDATAKEAHRLMTNHWIRHLPVLDESSGYIVGIISDRDLLRSPSPEIPVEELMTSPFKTFDVETPLADVVESMIEDKISAYLITNDDDVVGLVTSEDMLFVLDSILKEDEGKTWVLNEILTNPSLQRAAYIVGQTGI